MPKTITDPKISIVIPVYNGERYLSLTLDSILRQTFASFEVLCVNDCSSDGSLAILNAYASKDHRIRVLTTVSRQGIVPKVVNFSLPHIRGEYYAYSSQDDLFSEDWLEKMFHRGVDTMADATIPDVVFYHGHDHPSNRALIGLRGDRGVVLSNREAVLHSLDWTIPGFVLWNARLIKKIGYEEFGMYADEYSTRVFFFNCNRIVFSEGTFFYGQNNPGAITKVLSYGRFDHPYTHFKLYQFLKQYDFPANVYNGELLKAARELMQMKQLLIMNASSFSASDGRVAEQRIRTCYQCLRENHAERVVRKQDNANSILQALAVMNGYTMFNVACHVRVLLRRLQGFILERSRCASRKSNQRAHGKLQV